MSDEPAPPTGYALRFAPARPMAATAARAAEQRHQRAVAEALDYLRALRP
jgi:hypothetical protein